MEGSDGGHKPPTAPPLRRTRHNIGAYHRETLAETDAHRLGSHKTRAHAHTRIHARARTHTHTHQQLEGAEAVVLLEHGGVPLVERRQLRLGFEEVPRRHPLQESIFTDNGQNTNAKI